MRSSTNYGLYATINYDLAEKNRVSPTEAGKMLRSYSTRKSYIVIYIYKVTAAQPARYFIGSKRPTEHQEYRLRYCNQVHRIGLLHQIQSPTTYYLVFGKRSTRQQPQDICRRLVKSNWFRRFPALFQHTAENFSFAQS